MRDANKVVDPALAACLGREAATGFDEWARRAGLSYHLDRLFENGRSGAVVVLVTETDLLRRRSRKLVLKYTEQADPEHLRHRHARHSAGEFGRHIAEPVAEPVAAGGGWITRQTVAGGGADSFRPISALVRAVTGVVGDEVISPCVARDLAEVCGTVTGACLGRWAQAPYRVDLPLTGFLALHLSPEHDLAGLIGPYADPGPVEVLLRGDPEVPALLGRCHGDLTVENVLVRTAPRLEPADFHLIDLAKHQPEGPLTRDPVLLLLHLAVRYGGPGVWAGGALVDTLLDPGSPAAELLPGWFRRVLSHVTRTAEDWITESGFDGEWRAQTRLSLLAVAARLLGRVSTPEAHRPWLAALAVRAAGGRSAAPVHAAAPVPRQLPGPLPRFVGRNRELAELDRLTEKADVVVHGTAGAGKTALVRQWAAEAAGRYPDGQLYADLNGFSDAEPRDSADVLHTFLRALGVGPDDLPTARDDKAALFRTVTAGRRVLVVLDNVRDETQIRPLLPAAPPATVVVTSRDRLDGLAVTCGVRRLGLARMSPAEAAELVSGRAETELPPGVAAEVALRCAGLPLALAVAAALTAHPGSADRLLRGPLDLRDVFSWSTRHLAERPARLFRLLGAFPGRTFDAHAAAALLGDPLYEAEAAIESLVRVNLLEPATPGRFDVHDLLRAHAAESAGQEERAAAIARLADFHLAVVAGADRFLTPHRHHIADPMAGGTPPLDSYEAAFVWMETECENLAALCVALAPDPRCWRLAYTMRGYLFLTRSTEIWLRTHEAALTSARHGGDRWAEAQTLNNLGLCRLLMGSVDHAEQHYLEALRIFTADGDPHGESTSRNNLSWVAHYLGDNEAALRLARTALAFYREAGSRRAEAITLRGIALFTLALGRPREAADTLQETLTIFADLGLGFDETMGWNALGDALDAMGDGGAAAEAYRKALEKARACGSRHEETRAQAGLERNGSR